MQLPSDRPLSRTRRSAVTWTVRLFSSTAALDHTASIIVCLATRAPRRSTRTQSTSSAREPRDTRTGLPCSSSRYRPPALRSSKKPPGRVMALLLTARLPEGDQTSLDMFSGPMRTVRHRSGLRPNILVTELTAVQGHWETSNRLLDLCYSGLLASRPHHNTCSVPKSQRHVECAALLRPTMLVSSVEPWQVCQRVVS